MFRSTLVRLNVGPDHPIYIRTAFLLHEIPMAHQQGTHLDMPALKEWEPVKQENYKNTGYAGTRHLECVTSYQAG